MNAPLQRSRGFSLVEMMVSIGLLSLVVLVLFSLFNQTTKAMRANSNQTDVMEGARSGLEILGRDLENLAASGVPGAPNFVTYPTDAAREIFQKSVQQLGPALVPLHHDLFFLQRTDSKRVKVVGFVVRNEDQSSHRTLFPVGTLYRYEDPDPRSATADLNPTLPANVNYLPMVLTSPEARQNIAYRLLDRTRSAIRESTAADGPVFRSPHQTNLARVVDGVVSFRVTAFDQFNRPLDNTIWNYPDFGATLPNGDTRLTQPPVLAILDSTNLWKRYDATGSSVFIKPSRLSSDDKNDPTTTFTGSVFVGELVPATVEIEMAILEPRALEQLRAMPSSAANTLSGSSAREKYLQRNLGKIQIFRQRVPVRVALR